MKLGQVPHRWAHPLLALLVALPLLLVLAGAALVWRLSQGPMELAVLARLIETQANRAEATDQLRIARAAVAWGGLRSGEAAAPRLAWRPLLVIAGSVALFAVLLDRAGLVLTTAGIVALSRAGRAGHPWRETLLLAGGAALGAALVFRYGLGMQLPLWPDLG